MHRPFRQQVDEKVLFSISPLSPCPCGSFKLAKDCCLTREGFKKVPIRTSPPGSNTNRHISSCYASDLHNCGAKLSREHYISKALLNYLNRTNQMTVKGFPWNKGNPKKISPEALASRILCNRHNSALSSLDSIAVRLFQFFDVHTEERQKSSAMFLFSGHDIERWMLKTLCGLLFSKTFPEINSTIPKDWNEVLFGVSDFLDGQGLYVCKSKGHQFKRESGISIRPITKQDSLTGVGIEMTGIELVLSMSGFPSRQFDGREFVYRPLEIYMTGQNTEKSILFIWNGRADLGTIQIQSDQDKR